MSELEDSNLESMYECFWEALSELRFNMHQAITVREGTESSEEQVNPVHQLIHKKGIIDADLKTKEMDLILEDIEVLGEKMNEQQDKIRGLLERAELELGKIEAIGKSVVARFDEISQKERLVNEKSERNNLEENLLASQKEELLAEQRALEAANELLASRERELELREMVLSLKTPDEDGRESRLPNFNASQQGESEDLRGKSRKRARTDLDNEVRAPILPKRNASCENKLTDKNSPN